MDSISPPRCLSLDLEVGKDGSHIRALAAVRPDTGRTLVHSGRGMANALARLDDVADGASFVVGHNLIAFNLPILAAAKPNLRLLKLPAVDTLRLNPLAFPRNPYHGLVKHYQDGGLKRGRVNDPEMDARLTLQLFGDQRKGLGFAGLARRLALAMYARTRRRGPCTGRFLFPNPRSSPANPCRSQRGHPTHAARNHLHDTRARGRGQCGQVRLGTCIRPGVAIGGRRQFGDAALGAASVSRSRSVGATPQRRGLYRSGVRLVPETPRCSERTETLVQVRWFSSQAS